MDLLQDIRAKREQVAMARAKVAATSKEEAEARAELLELAREREDLAREKAERRKADNEALRLELDEQFGFGAYRFIDQDPAGERPDGHPSRYALRKPTAAEWAAFTNSLGEGGKDAARVNSATLAIVDKCVLFPKVGDAAQRMALHDFWKQHYPGEIAALGGHVAELAGLVQTEARKSG